MRSRNIWVVVALAILGVSVIGSDSGLAASSRPVYGAAIRLPGASGRTEPRVTVGPDNRRYVITNANRPAVVYQSDDAGASWSRTTRDPAGQIATTIDVDIIALPSGRLIASELDAAGLNFPTSYSDDRGTTWTASTGPQIADMDRQWLAYGPADPTTGQSRVYLLYHNFLGGFASHNMWVMTSVDGGEHFLPPVPVTLPQQQAYRDLQCADSGGPSSLLVNEKTGRLYVVFGSRSSEAVAGVEMVRPGGCAATPVEVNIVSATRVWVATSPDNTPGSWTQSLAVDRTAAGNVVGMQLSPGALDNAGNVWVSFPESPRPYPDFSGAAIRVVHAPPDLSGWSTPITIAKAGGPGNLVPHIVAGDPGKIAVAYYHGVSRQGRKPAWFTHVATSVNALSAHPTVVDQRLSSVPAYAWTASEMMGACTPPGPTSGISNGFDCDRSTDVWGMALDAACRVTVTWTTSDQLDGLKGNPGTWVATQTGGLSLCSRPGAARR